jgi:hypothetical protein
MVKAVKTSHPEQKTPKIYSLNETLPSVKDIYGSYEKLKALCMPRKSAAIASTAFQV